jgi:hypothetical protein
MTYDLGTQPDEAREPLATLLWAAAMAAWLCLPAVVVFAKGAALR